MYVNGKNTVVKDNATTPDIIEALLKAVPLAVDQCNGYVDSMIYKSGNPLVDAERCCRYIRANVKYKADGFSEQNIQLPGRMFKDTKQADCKSFSLAFVGMMEALGHDVGFRFASYRKNKIPTHVYNFVVCNGKKYTFDSCVENLKESPRYTFIKDMKVQYLSSPDYIGITQQQLEEYIKKARAKGVSEADIKKQVGKFIQMSLDAAKYGGGNSNILKDVASAAGDVFSAVKNVGLAPARAAILEMVKNNIRDVANKLAKTIAKNESEVKKFWERVGGDYSKLKSAVESGKSKAAIGFYYDDEEESYIGVIPVAVVIAIVTAAGPILAGLVNLFKKNDTDDGKTQTAQEKASAEKLPEGFVVTDAEKGSTFGFSPSPLMIGAVVGGIALIYFLTSKKGKK
jgi:hypothetical protein